MHGRAVYFKNPMHGRAVYFSVHKRSCMGF